MTLIRRLGAVLLAVTAVGAQDIITDPAKGGIDYKLQGEFQGIIANPEGGFLNIACQVAARGKGKFRATFFLGGLPGAGWDGETTLVVEDKTEDEQASFEGEFGGYLFTASVADDMLVIRSGDTVRYDLKRVERKSPTLGAKPPEGAIVLFDGDDIDAWAKGTLDGDRLNSHAEGVNNVSQGAVTKQAFRDFTLHLEFMTPFMPARTKQARANSGVYLQNRYEVQVLDSFGGELLQGTGNGDVAGDVYSKLGAKVNACLPPLTWQTYDIEFQSAPFGAAGQKVRNAVVTIKLNGVTVVDRGEIDGTTGGAGITTESAEPGPLMLQEHGNPMFFRNIWVVEKK
jgi:hypothetical protein